MQKQLLLDYEGENLSRNIRNLSYSQVRRNGTADIQTEKIKAVIKQYYPEGITDFEICVLTGISKSSVTARRNELKDVYAVGIAKIKGEGEDRLNTLWGYLSR